MFGYQMHRNCMLAMNSFIIWIWDTHLKKAMLGQCMYCIFYVPWGGWDLGFCCPLCLLTPAKTTQSWEVSIVIYPWYMYWSLCVIRSIYIYSCKKCHQVAYVFWKLNVFFFFNFYKVLILVWEVDLSLCAGEMRKLCKAACSNRLSDDGLVGIMEVVVLYS